MTPKICLVCEVCIRFVWIGNERSPVPHTLVYHQTAGVRCQNNLRGDVQNMHWTLHAYLHTLTGLWWLTHEQLQRELTQTPNTLCRAAAGVSAGVTRHVSHSIPCIRTGDSPRGHKRAKDGNLIPGRKSNAPTSAANVIHSSCDTTAMCWGLFLRNERLELESCWILLASVWTISWRG